MPTKRGYKRYIHTIRSAYASIGRLPEDFYFPPPEVLNLSRHEAFLCCFEHLRKRLVAWNPAADALIFTEAKSVNLSFHNKEVLIPLINKEGYD